MKKIAVFIGQRGGKINKVSLQACRIAAEIAGKNGTPLEAVVVGNEIEGLATLGKYGIQKVTHYKYDELTRYSASAYTNLISDFITSNEVEMMLFPNSSMVKDFLPRVSARLKAGLAMDCIGFNYESENIIATRPVYAGKALTEVKINTPVKLFTVRANVFSVNDSYNENCEVNIEEISEPDLSIKVIEEIQSNGKVDLTEAEIIVSGGRGLKGPENFGMIEELARQLNAAVGASRPVCDSGWRPHSDQVGQTGKTVSPKLYVAVGISGAIQHQAGMRSAKYIVAINKDENAPIFSIADYGIAGDAFEIVPAITEELKRQT